MYSLPYPAAYYPDESTSEEEDEQEVDPSDLSILTSWKQNLGRTINAIETFGDVAWSKSYQNIVLPGLEVGGTAVSLPVLAPRETNVIRDACFQAPPGRGAETLDFSFSNPQWPSFINALLDEASSSLSMPRGVRAELDKLALHGPGSVFTRREESEKPHGTIATLAICLPSAHVGGDVHVTHNGKTNVLATSHASAFEVTALAWYSDVTVESKEITCGQRVVVTYNITSDEGQTGKASAIGFLRQQAKLESILKHGYTHYANAPAFLYQLSHKYPEPSLTLQSLKGHDRARVDALQKACASCGYILLLANAIKTKEEYEEKNQYLNSDDYRLEYVATCDGSQVGSEIPFEKSSFIGSKPYRDRSADSVEEMKYTEATTYLYHDTAAVIVCKHNLSKFINFRYLREDNIARNFVKLVASAFSDTDDRSGHEFAVAQLRQLMASPSKSGMGETCSEILSFAFTTRDMDLLNDVLSTVLASPGINSPVSRYYAESSYPSGGVGYGYGGSGDLGDPASLELVLSRFASHVDDHGAKGFDFYWDGCIGKLVTSFPDTDRLEKAMNTLSQKMKHAGMKQSLQIWLSNMGESRFYLSDCLKSSDIPLIISLLHTQGTLEWVNDSFLPVLKRTAKRSMIVDLIPEVLECDVPPSGKTVANAILDEFSIEFDPKALESTVKPAYSSGPRPHWSEVGAYSNYGNSAVARWLKLVKGCMSHGLLGRASQFLEDCCEKILEEHKAVMPPEPTSLEEKNPFGVRYPLRTLQSPIKTSWAELFLADVVDTIQLSATPAPISARLLFERLIRHYLLPQVPVRPAKPSGWAHKPRQCANGCHACRELVKFLTSESENTHHFKMNLPERKHIEEKLPRAYFDCLTLKVKPPHILVVTKRGDEYQDNMMWFNRCLEELEKKLLSLKTPLMRTVLGDEFYAELILLEKIRSGPDGEPSLAPTEEANATAPGHVLAEGSGNKRPAVEVLEQLETSKMRVGGVVDLTGDDW